ncbi:MAG: rfaE bifunctional protein [Candidatus Kaiserbacteria bacterium]|nr:rfaE bifunctional protein [Candidatus Kaiserbacteria bacterium]
MQSTLKKFIRDTKKIQIAVIGDVMLDQFSYGFIARMSPECSTAPVIQINHTSYFLGGALNVANNIITLGGHADIYSIVGNDTHADLLLRLSKKSQIPTKGIVKSKNATTTVKQRVVVNDAHHARVDFEKNTHVSKDRNTLLNLFLKNITSYDIVIISDYAKGVIDEQLLQKIALNAKKHSMPIIVDTKPAHIHMYKNKNIHLFTPNTKELHESVGVKHYKKAAHKFVQDFGTNVLVTRGADGMSHFDQNLTEIHQHSHSSNVVDVSGCGDTVIGALSLALALRYSITDAIYIASVAAAVVVEKQGVSSVTKRELLRQVSDA